MLATSLCSKNTCPPRNNSRKIASLSKLSDFCMTKVLIANRLAGGVAIIDMLRIPDNAMFSVRGMGVAVIDSTSTSDCMALIRSLSRTPKRCSSSTIIRPKLANLTSSCKIRWVPMTISTCPFAKSAKILSCCFLLPKRDSDSIRMGQSANRSKKLSSCCPASSVVGTSTATWYPACTAIKAARIATSVLPKPTSPHTSLSMGLFCFISNLTASMALAWSGVSSNANWLANKSYWIWSIGKLMPTLASRRACTLSSSAATSWIWLSALALALSHLPLPMVWSGAVAESPPA